MPEWPRERQGAPDEHDHAVTLAFADKGKNEYLTISGPASVSNDRDKIRDLFNVFAKAAGRTPTTLPSA